MPGTCRGSDFRRRKWEPDVRIAFYAPFKPLDHDNPSGDRFIGRSIVRFLESRGHTVEVYSRLRARWIYWKPWLWPVLARDFLAGIRRCEQRMPDLWLTYHCYYKAPDLLGPWVSRVLGIPYVIFQGIYSTRPRRRIRTAPGFYLNRAALEQAVHVFTNRQEDLANLRRLLPESRVSYVRPGIHVREFVPAEAAESCPDQGPEPDQGPRRRRPVIGSAAMFRDDVKARGLAWLIQCCGRLLNDRIEFHLVIAGSGPMEPWLRSMAEIHAPGHVTFAGRIPGSGMERFYRSCDLFAFPGIRESLGMVFLEAQACGLPVVAFDNGGIPEVVEANVTGFLVPMYDAGAFAGRLRELISSPDQCRAMGLAARARVETLHDLDKNYGILETKLLTLVQESLSTGRQGAGAAGNPRRRPGGAGRFCPEQIRSPRAGKGSQV